MNESFVLPQSTVFPNGLEFLTDISMDYFPMIDGLRPMQSLLEDVSLSLDAPSEMMGENLDRAVHAMMARFTLGVSPGSVMEAYADWFAHLAIAPGKQWQLLEHWTQKNIRLFNYGLCSALWFQGETCAGPVGNDRRFAHGGWQTWPFNLIHQSFLLKEQWWSEATTGVRGVSKHHEKMVTFGTRQLLDTFSPSNNFFTNPEVIQATITEGGTNLLRGWMNWWDDWQRAVTGKRPAGCEDYQVGKNIAVTPGNIVFRNKLIELIQYSPSTPQTNKVPLLVVPAWIMKYYILDLSEGNSFFNYLVQQGFTVFTISWKNPTNDDRDLSMDDYRVLGIEAALEAIEAITGESEIHTAGYCLGGTLLSIAAATQARQDKQSNSGNGALTDPSKHHKRRIKSVCLLAAQTDFAEAGELMLFVDQSQITFLEDMMWHQGVLDNEQMAGAFQMLRSNDLIWSRMIREYMLGERSGVNDLMAWNSDSTRMPYKMHSEYLRKLFLENQLSQGHYLVDEKPISITDIRAPIFAVGTEKDHVAPWQSVYKIHILSDTDVTFVLTSGGHNAGIVSEPGHPRRRFRQSTRTAEDSYIDPNSWFDQTSVQQGSWWPQYVAWLTQIEKENIDPIGVGNASKGYPVLGDAPGTYVFQQ